MGRHFCSWHVNTLCDGALTTSAPFVQTPWSNIMDDADTLTAVAAERI